LSVSNLQGMKAHLLHTKNIRSITMGNLYVFYIVYDIDMKKSEFGILKWYFNGLEHIH